MNSYYEPYSPVSFDRMLAVDNERRREYNHLSFMMEEFVKDENYVDGELRMTEDEEFYDYLTLSKQYNAIKKTIIAHKYAAKYSKFQLGERVQVVLNNRIYKIGTVADIQVMTTQKAIQSYYHPDLLNQLRGAPVNDNMVRYVLDEFVYIVEFPTMVAKFKKPLLPPSRTPVKSNPLLLLPVPNKLLTQCPVCKIYDKPLMNAMLGGEIRIICYDCYAAIKDMYGRYYTETTLTFGELIKTKNIEKIADISSKQ